MSNSTISLSAADDILAPISRMIGRLIGRTSDCGLDCDVSDLGIAEYLLLLIVFILVFVMARKIKNLITEKRDGNHT